MTHLRLALPPLRALELFCGIGGFAAALDPAQASVVGAMDLSPHVLEVYRHNYPEHTTRQINLDFIKPAQLDAYGATMWWMSPPCQPYTTRGRQRDLEDRRARSLPRLMDSFERLCPDALGLENVPGFVDSQAHALVLETLQRAGYEVRERRLCPTELGVPARRERYYLVASRRGLAEVAPAAPAPRQLASYLDDTPLDALDPALIVPEAIVASHGPGMRILDLEADPDAIANTFTGAYGKTWRAAGSFLRLADGRVRLLSPAELLRLLGFPPEFNFPAQMPLRHQYKAVGNSLSVVAMREVLRPLWGA